MSPIELGAVPEERAAQVKEVIRLIEDGTSETAACDQVGINRMTFRQAAFKLQAASEYARAFVALAENQINEIEKTIADMRAGSVETQAARVEIDARKWLASKLFPRRYGDRQTLEHSGAGGGPITFASFGLDDLNPNERAALRAILARRAEKPDGGAEGA